MEPTRNTAWDWVVALQDQRHPGWRTNMQRTMLTTGLSSEVGEVCDQVTHLDGGGSRLLDLEKWNPNKLLHALVDSWVMIVLTAEKSGFTEADFWEEWKHVRSELTQRVEESIINQGSGT